MDLKPEVARAIVDAVVEGDYAPRPSEEELNDEYYCKTIAIYWIGEAEKVWLSDPSFAKNDETIRTVLNMSPNGFPVKQAKSAFGGGQLEIEDSLPIPPEPTFDYETLPNDFTELSDMQIRKYSSHYAHYFNRAKYLQSLCKNQAASAIHLRDDVYNTAYKEVNDDLAKQEKRATRDLVDSIVKMRDDYKKYDNDARKSQEAVIQYGALVEIYSGNVDRLSREWTMRQDEWRKENNASAS